LLRLGRQNLDEIEATVGRLGIDCGFIRSGELTVAVAPWQLSGLKELYDEGRRLGEPVELLDAGQARALVDSPTYLGAVRDPDGTAVLDPVRLVSGLAAACERLGVRIFEHSRAGRMRDEGDTVVLPVDSPSGRYRVRASRVVLGTNAFPSPLRTLRPFVVPVWDHVLATEPLSGAQRAAIGWAGGEGLSDAGNQFHYYRLTEGGRLIWGGYDALYYYGSSLAPSRMRRASTETALATHLFDTFPQLSGIRITHAWAGAIDTCTRFTAFWRLAMGGKVAAVQGYTGLGVGASRFGARVALDLVDGVQSERTALSMVRSSPVPFPPEPFRWAGITLTRRSIARADAHDGRRDLWLRMLDRLGLGFDS
jgi:glycine/D-amino acid oxidase-like deaminating enzyme